MLKKLNIWNILFNFQTIIFIRISDGNNEISGYIDYRHRLSQEEWRPYFEGQKKVRPNGYDLGYYHWRIGKNNMNPTPNYKVIKKISI